MSALIKVRRSKERLGKHLKRFREDKGLTQVEVGRLAEMPQSQICAVENGRGTLDSALMLIHSYRAKYDFNIDMQHFLIETA